MVLIDGRDLNLYDPKWLRRHVALVSQEPVLFARSIKRNIIYGLEAEDGCTDTPTEVLEVLLTLTTVTVCFARVLKGMALFEAAAQSNA
jgi:ABC-type multidrug transport system fused ATPase/permease subunit